MNNAGRNVKYLALACLAGVIVAGCAESPPQPRRPARVAVAPPPPLSPKVYFYPLQGQSAEQQDRDKYECYLWARKETGFDPGSANAPVARRVEVVPAPAPGGDTAVGAVTGAVIGAAVSSPRNVGGGAVIGGVVGAIAGAVSDQAREEQAQRVQERYDHRSSTVNANWEQRVQEYRRAMRACLEGRGYSVQ